MANDHWCTPEWVLEPIRELSGVKIGLDPCSNGDSIVGAQSEFHGPPDGIDGLDASWAGHGLVFVNPPYSRGNLERWTSKCGFEATGGRAEIVALLKDDPTTKWWQRNVVTGTINEGASAIARINRRVAFIGAGGSPRFGSVLVYWGPRPGLFSHLVGRIAADFVDTNSWRYRRA